LALYSELTIVSVDGQDVQPYLASQDFIHTASAMV
jgi:hypothetical protein